MEFTFSIDPKAPVISKVKTASALEFHIQFWLRKSISLFRFEDFFLFTESIRFQNRMNRFWIIPYKIPQIILHISISICNSGILRQFSQLDTVCLVAFAWNFSSKEGVQYEKDVFFIVVKLLTSFLPKSKIADNVFSIKRAT